MSLQEMLGKEKLKDTQKRLVEKREHLKDQLQLINDSVKKNLVVPTSSIFIRKSSQSSSLNPRKPLPNVVHHPGNSSQIEILEIQQTLQDEQSKNIVERAKGSGDSSPTPTQKNPERNNEGDEQTSPRLLKSSNKLQNKSPKEISEHKEVVPTRLIKSPKKNNEVSGNTSDKVLKSPKHSTEVTEHKETGSENFLNKKRSEQITKNKKPESVNKSPRAPKSEDRSDEIITKEIGSENKSAKLLKNTTPSKDINTNAHTSQQHEKIQLPPRTSKKRLTKKKLSSIDSKTQPQRKTSKKVIKKQIAANISKYFPAKFMTEYCKETDDTPFTLPLRDFSELMSMKEEVGMQIKSNITSLDSTIKQIKNPDQLQESIEEKKKCFSQITQELTTNPEDGIITNCYITNKYLVIVQHNKINTYLKTDSPKKWTLKDSMTRKQVPNRIKELMVPCFLDNTDSIVLCDMYLDREKHSERSILRMIQYRFLPENGKHSIIVTLGSFDINLTHFQCNYLRRRLCTIAVSAWAPEESRSIVWIFTQSADGETLRCTPMIPVDHEVLTLQDITAAAPSKTLLLGFGKRYFTIWNVKSGERFIFVDLSRLGRVKTMSCFSSSLVGFLFQIIGFKDVLHMVSVNLGTGIFKTTRKFKVPEEETCINASISDDRLIGVTKKYVICWSLRSSNLLQVVKLLENENVYFFSDTLLLMTTYKFRRIVYTKSIDEIKKEHELRKVKNNEQENVSGDKTETEETTSSSEETTSSEN